MLFAWIQVKLPVLWLTGDDQEKSKYTKYKKDIDENGKTTRPTDSHTNIQ